MENKKHDIGLVTLAATIVNRHGRDLDDKTYFGNLRAITETLSEACDGDGLDFDYLDTRLEALARRTR